MADVDSGLDFRMKYKIDYDYITPLIYPDFNIAPYCVSKKHKWFGGWQLLGRRKTREEALEFLLSVKTSEGIAKGYPEDFNL